MPRHSYDYYDGMSLLIYVVFLVFFLILLFTVLISPRCKRCYNTKIWAYLVSKVFLSLFFVSVTITLAQILFGFRAVKQKRRDPSIIVINGRYYKLNGFTLGTIAYYNCITIYTIIYVFLQFIIRKTPWSVEDCNSGADCFYLNYSAIPSYSREDSPGIPIENCTLESNYDEKDVTCYSIGFHPAVGIALLGGFINIVTPLLFAFYVGLQVKLFGKIIKKMHDDEMKGKSNHYRHHSYKFRCKLLKITLFYSLFLNIILCTSITFVILVYLNYETPKDHQSSFEKMFSSESFFGQSIAFCILNFAFCMYPVMLIERYPATQDNNEHEHDDDNDAINQNEAANFARGSSSRRGASRGGSSRGGASRGGSSRGGASRGGSSRGGASRGGSSRGGSSRGGLSRGGSSRGGSSRGGSSRGGSSRGGSSRSNCSYSTA